MVETGPAIEVVELTKHYAARSFAAHGAGVLAVDGVSFSVQRGEVFGFLGPNGAGKTTTIRMLTGLARPTSGWGRVLGLDLARDLPRIKKRIGVVPEASNLYGELTAYDNLIFSMALYGVPRHERAPRAEELLDAEQTYPAEWIEEAFRIAVTNNVRRWVYVRRILERWADEGRGERCGTRSTVREERPAYGNSGYEDLIRK